MITPSLRRLRRAGANIARFARHEPIGALGMFILVVWSVVAVGAIGSGGGWLGVGRYDSSETFKTLNPEFALLKAAGALDGQPADLPPNELQALLAAPGVYGPFADAADAQDEIQAYIQPLIVDEELLPLLSAGRFPYIEIADGTIHAVDQGFSADANRPLISAALQGPSTAHWFGTNRAGNDIYAIVVDEAWHVLYVGFLAALFGVVGGIVLTLALRPLRWNRPGQAFHAAIGAGLDGLLALSPFVLLLMVAFGHGPRDFATILPLAGIALPLVWRVFANAAPDASRSDSLLRVARNVMLIAILSEAALSFIGLNDAGWGIQIAYGRQWIIEAPWLTLFAGLALTSVLVGVYTSGRGLRHLLVPSPPGNLHANHYSLPLRGRCRRQRG